MNQLKAVISAQDNLSQPEQLIQMINYSSLNSQFVKVKQLQLKFQQTQNLNTVQLVVASKLQQRSQHQESWALPTN